MNGITTITVRHKPSGYTCNIPGIWDGPLSDKQIKYVYQTALDGLAEFLNQEIYINQLEIIQGAK